MAEAGATVICAARTRSQLDEAVAAIEAAGGKARAVELDMADLEGMDAALEQCGPIDILFNNAGMNIRQPIVEVSEENYDQIMAVNLKGLYFLSQKVGRQMIERGQGGKIINIGSLTTGYALAKVSVYTATKGAVGQLTKGQAIEFGSHNIQVNAICPGFIITSLSEKLWADDTMRAWGEGRVVLNRLGTPEDLVGTAVFSRRASFGLRHSAFTSMAASWLATSGPCRRWLVVSSWYRVRIAPTNMGQLRQAIIRVPAVGRRLVAADGEPI